jgi:2-keto-3-deoxy-L-rhamnonate aldolase RhmA
MSANMSANKSANLSAANSAQIGDILRNHVKDKLARGEVVSSMTVRLIRGVEIARIAKTAGFDSLYVDMEHSSFSLETISQICIAALEAGITPLVRVPGVADVQRILDAGALGIIAPHVQSAAAARDYVRAAKYPPRGDRSNAGPLPHLQYRSFPTAEAYAALNAATMVIVQFESAEAIARADEIMAVDGVDMVLIGTNDLLADFGLPGQYDHPRVREAYTKTLAACRTHGKHLAVGGFASRPDLAADYVRLGARYVSTGTDLGFLLAACAAKAKEVQEMRIGDKA